MENNKTITQKAQGAIEYLLIIGAAILVVAIVIIAVTGSLSTSKTDLNNSNKDVNSAYDSIRGLGGIGKSCYNLTGNTTPCTKITNTNEVTGCRTNYACRNTPNSSCSTLDKNTATQCMFAGTPVSCTLQCYEKNPVLENSICNQEVGRVNTTKWRCAGTLDCGKANETSCKTLNTSFSGICSWDDTGTYDCTQFNNDPTGNNCTTHGCVWK